MATETLWLCIDCREYALLISEEERGRKYPQPVIDAFSDPSRILNTATIGATEHTEDCESYDEETGTTFPDGNCECDHITFTWNRCEGCLSTLGGERFAFTIDEEGAE